MKKLWVILIFLFFATKLNASGLALLKTDMFPDAIARGGAVVSDISGPQSLYWNTAGISSDTDIHFIFNHTIYYLQTSIDNLAITIPLQNLTIGAGYTYFSSGEIDEYGDKPSDDGPIGTFKLSNTIFNIAVGFKVGNFLHGVGLKTYTTKFKNFKSSDYMIDYGVQYHKKNNRNYFGFAVRNIGSRLNYYRDSVLPPYYVQIGYSYKAIGDIVKLSNDLRIELAGFAVKYDIGISIHPAKTMRFMFGWNKVDFMNLKDLNNVCAGVSLDMGNIKVTYSVKYHGLLGMVNSIAVAMQVP